MTVEQLPAAGPPMGAQVLEGARRDAAAPADGGAGSAFQALLASIGQSDELQADGAAADVPVARDGSGAAGGPQDAPLVSDGPPASLPALATVDGMVTHASGALVVGGAVAIASAAPVAVPSATDHAPVRTGSVHGRAATGGQALASGQPASSDMGTTLQTPGDGLPAPGGRRPGFAHALAAPVAHGAGEPADGTAAQERTERVVMRQAQVEAAASAQLRQGAAAGGAAAAPQLASLFEVGPDGLRASARWRGHERTTTRELVASAAHGMAPLADPDPALRQGTGAPAAPGAPAPLASALAEKVHYWVARGVQGAELRLDAFGGGSVDVRIALRGDEAMVEFRTDQPQARQLLAEAMPQLKDLLAGTGLTLAGGFVGGSGQSGAGSQGRDAPAQPRGEAVLRPDAATLVRATRLGTATGTTVDLFV